MEPGFSKESAENLSKVDFSMVDEFYISNLHYLSAEIRNIKTNVNCQKAGNQLYVTPYIMKFVPVCREGHSLFDVTKLKKMEIQERICGICLERRDSCKAIEGIVKDFLDVLLSKINLTAIREPMICTNCTEMLIKCFNFKMACRDTFNRIVSFINNEDDVKVDLRLVYLSKNGKDTCVLEGQDVCGFCLGPVKNCSAIALNFEAGDVTLKRMIEQCLPELDISIIGSPVICEPCYSSLGIYFSFVTSCLSVEKKIKTYREILDINSRSQIEVSNLLQFTLKDVKNEVDGSVDLIKSEEQFCDSENAEEKIEIKIESFMDIDDTKFNNDQQFSSKYMMTCKEESNNANEITETFCEEKESQFAVGVEDQKFLIKEEIEIKTDEEDKQAVDSLYRNQEYLTPNSEGDPSNPYIKRSPSTEHLTELTEHRHELGPFPAKNDPQTREDPSDPKTYNRAASSYQTPCKELPEYKCNSCPYQSKLKYRLKRHLLVHSDPSEIRMYKCNSCSYKTKRKGSLKVHSLVHKDLSEVEVYKCKSCSYQGKSNYLLKRHLLVHKNPSDVRIFKCEVCAYQTKHSGSLKVHLLVHKDRSEVATFECGSCAYRAKSKYLLKRHLLVHQNLSEIRVHKCEVCSFQTKHKGSLKVHLLAHKDPSEVVMYKCNSCSYQAKGKYLLKSHSLVHKDPSEIRIYTCELCSFQTRHGGSLKVHLLAHKESPEAAMYKCNSCSYQAKGKSHLTRHLLVHKDPSEVRVYECGSCSYQTKSESSFKAHLLVHKDSAEAPTYKCESCSFLTKYKGSIKKHSLLHKAPSEVVMYNCGSCSFQTKHKGSLKKHSLLHQEPPEAATYKRGSFVSSKT